MADGEYRRLGCAAIGCKSPLTGKATMYCTNRCKVATWKDKNPQRARELRRREQPKQPTVSYYYADHCKQCGAAFGARRQRAFCTPICESRWHYSTTWESTAPDVRICTSCGSNFANRPHKTRPTDFCSEPCRRAAIRAQKLRRKCQERAATVETVNPIKVFTRDHWRCQLCGVKTPQAKRGTYDDDAPELDHIVPLARGGEHSYRNTQCACRRCNGAKGDRPLGQLLLVG